MRADVPCGDQKYVYTYAVATTATVELPGTDLVFEVPAGCIALVHASGQCKASSNTLGWGLRLETGDVSIPQESTTGDRFSVFSWKVGPGRHRASIWCAASSVAGQFVNFSIDYVIVRKDSR